MNTKVFILTLLALGMLPPVTTMAGGSGRGFAWADKPTSEAYQPPPSYAYNAAGKDIHITRRGEGTYVVRFEGLGGKGAAGGHAQVSAYGPGNEYCKLSRWDSGREDFKVWVKCFAADGKARDSRFVVEVSWPAPPPPDIKFLPMQPELFKTPDTSQQPTTPNAAKRSISPQGEVVLSYPDGRVEKRYKGGKTIILPDGQEQKMLFSTAAPPAIPPALPDDAEGLWLEYHNAGLLAIIENLVGHDSAAMENYLAFEGDAVVYEKIARRRQTIDYLSQP